MRAEYSQAIGYPRKTSFLTPVLLFGIFYSVTKNSLRWVRIVLSSYNPSEHGDKQCSAVRKQ